MKLILAWWHEMRADLEDQELLERSIDGSASDVWASQVIWLINWRRQEAVALRNSSRTLRFYRAVAAAVRDLRRSA